MSSTSLQTKPLPRWFWGQERNTRCLNLKHLSSHYWWHSWMSQTSGKSSFKSWWKFEPKVVWNSWSLSLAILRASTLAKDDFGSSLFCRRERTKQLRPCWINWKAPCGQSSNQNWVRQEIFGSVKLGNFEATLENFLEVKEAGNKSLTIPRLNINQQCLNCLLFRNCIDAAAII